MKSKISVKTEIEIILPLIPNFVRAADKSVGAIPLADLTEDQVIEISKQWSEALLLKFRSKRKSKIKGMNKKLSEL
jgi:hypothetical protein|tara:strand:+ start:366 stop:593 length:228 start_codon:yes stop_codon:yes gene_type:complete